MLDIEKFADTGQLFDNHYKLIRPLNTEGGTADVWLALDTTTVSDKGAIDRAPYLDDVKLSEVGLLVAIKIYKPKNALDIEGERRFREEFVIVFNCNHANLIHPVYFSIFEETPYLVLPYCQRGSSELLIGSFVSDDDIWHYIHDVAAGLNYLHHCNPPIIHQDIKPANVLIDDSGNYAITDFGISAKRYKGVSSNTDNDDYEEQSGTCAYMAPERFIEGNIPSAESDIWAFGATLYELLTGRVPFGEDGGQAQQKLHLQVPAIPGVSTDVQRLIHDCLAADPAARPTARQIAEAARVHQYPLKSRKSLWITLLAVLLLMLVGVGIFLRPDPTPAPAPIPPPLPPEVLFDKAIYLMDSCNQIDSLNKGLYILDSLSVQKYVPAMYEIALTYGWSGNEKAIARKRLLGIKTDDRGMPIDDIDNQKSVTLLDEILNLSDSAYAYINGRAANMRAVYEYDPNPESYKRRIDEKKAQEYLHIAEFWATKAEDQVLLERVRKELKKLKN